GEWEVGNALRGDELPGHWRVGHSKGEGVVDLDQTFGVGQLLGRVGAVVVDLGDEAPAVDAAVVVDVLHARREAHGDLLAVDGGRARRERRAPDHHLVVVGPVVVGDLLAGRHTG